MSKGRPSASRPQFSMVIGTKKTKVTDKGGQSYSFKSYLQIPNNCLQYIWAEIHKRFVRSS